MRQLLRRSENAACQQSNARMGQRIDIPGPAVVTTAALFFIVVACCQRVTSAEEAGITPPADASTEDSKTYRFPTFFLSHQTAATFGERCRKTKEWSRRLDKALDGFTTTTRLPRPFFGALSLLTSAANAEILCQPATLKCGERNELVNGIPEDPSIRTPSVGVVCGSYTGLFSLKWCFKRMSQP